jgi:outer membrane protein assembly factor BamB/tetratricopeptide (TPR) repeat protein
MTHDREILSEAEVDFLLQEAAAEPTAAPEAPGTEGQTATMRGDLEQIGLTDIFQTLSMSKMEGVLRVSNALEERSLYCCDGRVRILVPPRITFRRLGQRLIQAGLLTPDALRATLALQRKDKVPLGQLLVREGHVNQQQVEDIVSVQIAEDLFSLFTWRHGTFAFFKGEAGNEQLRSRFEGCPEYEVSSLLLEVARRSDEWEDILASIVDLEEVPTVIARVEDESTLSPSHHAVLAQCDGQATYREIANQTTFALFDIARAARDLVRGGILANIPEAELLAAAARLAEEGENRRALVRVQALRDRNGTLDVGLLRALADVLTKLGERRQAAEILIEAAQQSDDPAEALATARAARELAPFDAGTLSFLRTMLVAHAPADSPELQKCTLDLVDAFIDADLSDAAVEVLDDMRRTNRMSTALLVREARARQRVKDVVGASVALLELGQSHLAEGNRTKAIEAYEALVRLDGSRRDVQRLITQLRQTRVGRAVRTGAIVLTIVMIGGMAVAWWNQRRVDEMSAAAIAQVDECLQRGDLTAATKSLDRWRPHLGDGETTDDLQSRIHFAAAAEQNRQQKLRRMRINEELSLASKELANGNLDAALAQYRSLWSEQDLRDEIAGIVESRLGAVLDTFDRTGKELLPRLPPEPTALLDRRALNQNLQSLREACPPAVLANWRSLQSLEDGGRLADMIGADLRARIRRTLESTRQPFTRAQRLADAYADFLARGEAQRRLDPVFKAAVECERQYDFQGALERYRELERQHVGGGELRDHFRSRIARNAAIVHLLEQVATATEAGDHATACQHLRALRGQYPEVPFDSLVLLPLTIESQPTGALVAVGGKALGKTPLVVRRHPAQQVEITVSHPGFATTSQVWSGEGTARWLAPLPRLATWSFRHSHAIDAAPVPCADGSWLCVDRSGTLLLLSADGKVVRWRFETNDLSGWLTRPLVDDTLVVVGSLDGTLRGIDRRTGALVWSVPDLATDVQPTWFQGMAAIATRDAQLVLVDRSGAVKKRVPLPEAPFGRIVADDQVLCVVGHRGHACAFRTAALTPAWSRALADLASPHVLSNGGIAVVADEQGHVHALDVATGAERWRRSLDTGTLGRPTLDGHIVYLSTPSAVLRLSCTTGEDLGGLPARDLEWHGPVEAVADSLVFPMCGAGAIVLDAREGTARFRLPGDRRTRYLQAGGAIFAIQADHTIEFHGALR